jgi:hypothetical protein
MVFIPFFFTEKDKVSDGYFNFKSQKTKIRTLGLAWDA